MKKEYDFSKATRGPVIKTPAGQTTVSILIDQDILDWFRNEADQSGGGNYQSLINLALRDHIKRAR